MAAIYVKGRMLLRRTLQYLTRMIAQPLLRPVTKLASSLAGVLIAAMPAHAGTASHARLVHCGQDTCLRLSGHRRGATVAIQMGGHELAVEGGRSWRVTMPLATAREWGSPSGDALTLTLVDPQNNLASADQVMLPPGALGRRVELATLVVRAR